MSKEMKDISVTWGHAIQVWWAISWRSLSITIPIAFAFGFLFGFLITAAGKSVEQYQIYLRLIGFTVGFIATIAMFKKVLSKSFKGFRVTIVTDVENCIRD